MKKVCLASASFLLFTSISIAQIQAPEKHPRKRNSSRDDASGINPSSQRVTSSTKTKGKPSTSELKQANPPSTVVRQTNQQQPDSEIKINPVRIKDKEQPANPTP